MARKTSIYIPDAAQAVIGDVGEGQLQSLSGRLASICERYGLIVARHRPAFSKAEWCLILDALNGCQTWALSDRTEMARSMVWAEVADHVRLNRADEKWGIADADALVARIRDLPIAEILSVIEAAERFWQHSDLDTDAAMAAAGIVPAAPTFEAALQTGLRQDRA